MVKAMQEVGVLLPSADTVELEKVMTTLFARFGGMGFVEPYAEQLIRDEGGNLAADLGRQALDNVGVLWRMPARVDAVLT